MICNRSETIKKFVLCQVEIEVLRQHFPFLSEISSDPYDANEVATQGGKIVDGTKTDIFVKAVKMPAHPQLSGRVMEFDGKGECVGRFPIPSDRRMGWIWGDAGAAALKRGNIRKARERVNIRLGQGF